MKFVMFVTWFFLVVITIVVVRENVVQIKCALKKEKTACVLSKTKRTLTSLMWFYILSVSVVTTTLREIAGGASIITGIVSGLKSSFLVLLRTHVGLVFILYIELLCWQFYLDKKHRGKV